MDSGIDIEGKLKGFTPLLDKLLKDKKLGLYGAAIYGRVLRYTHKTGHCWASMATIGEELGISERTIFKYVKMLIEDGYLEDNTPGLRNRPHSITLTDKVRIVQTTEVIIEDESPKDTCNESCNESVTNRYTMKEIQSGMKEIQSTTQEIHSTMREIPMNKESNKELNKECIEKRERENSINSIASSSNNKEQVSSNIPSDVFTKDLAKAIEERDGIVDYPRLEEAKQAWRVIAEREDLSPYYGKRVLDIYYGEACHA